MPATNPDYISTTTMNSQPAPKKYVKVDGITKLNPLYKKWKESQGQTATTLAYPAEALPIVSSMDDHEKLSAVSVAAGGPEVPLAESTSATIEMLQEPEIAMDAGMSPDDIIDQLGVVMNKYEAPMGLMNKLMVLSEFNVLEFMVDDSGSMSMVSDTVNPTTRMQQTRWCEAQNRLKEMIEILAYVPFQEIQVCFLNRRDRLSMKRNGRPPHVFLADAYRQIDGVFSKGPTGSTPFLQRLQESFTRFGPNSSIARYFFGDGTPDGGNFAKEEIIKLLRNRSNPEGNPMTFLSCTDDDAQVEWMKDAEEIIPYCSECDDFKDEAAEVYKDQGVALPFSFGFYLICTLVAAMNPDDLDAMDESVPFTKTTLDNLLGIEHDEQSYRHYFDHYVNAQRAREIGVDDYGRPKRTDQLKKNADWVSMYQDFLRAPVANQIPAVQHFKRQLME
jgi:hypothetical protein